MLFRSVFARHRFTGHGQSERFRLVTQGPRIGQRLEDCWRIRNAGERGVGFGEIENLRTRRAPRFQQPRHLIHAPLRGQSFGEMDHEVYIVVLMSDWNAISQAAGLDIPADAMERIAPTLDALHASFRPLLAKIPHTLDPAIILSEKAVRGE